MRKLQFFVLLATVLLLSACSSGGSDSPSDNNAHPESWFSSHAEALTDSDYDECKQCHAPDLRGSGEAVSCYSCHYSDNEPPVSTHPTSWINPYSDHRYFAARNGFDSCAACHGATLQGYQTAPSCYSVSFEGAACHQDGPQETTHPLDGTYNEGANHGPDAKADLTDCQSCHGELGGPGSSPRFNIGIDTTDGRGCEGCHGENGAHPQEWPGCPGHNSAGNIHYACTLCHGADLDGIDLDDTESAGGSCFECHSVSPDTYPTDCVSCHNTPPDSGTPVGDISPNRMGQHDRIGHTTSINLTPTETCARCHNGAGSCSDNHYDMDAPADVNLPLHPLDTINPVWDGTNMTCNGSCHLNGFDIIHSGSKWY